MPTVPHASPGTLFDWFNGSKNKPKADASPMVTPERRVVSQINDKANAPWGIKPTLTSGYFMENAVAESPRAIPILGNDFNELHGDQNEANMHWFRPRDCICKNVNLATMLESGKAIYIAGSFVHFSRSHLSRLLVQSGMSMTTNVTSADLVLLGWWIDQRILKRIMDRKPLIITENKLLYLLDNLKESCNHLKLIRPHKLLPPNFISSGKLFSCLTRPMIISNIAGHQDALERLHAFLLAAKVPKDSSLTNRRKSIYSKHHTSNLFIAIYPPGTCTRLGVELVCKAAGLECVYCNVTSENDNAYIDKNSVAIYPTSNVDSTFITRVEMTRASIKIALCEDSDGRFGRFSFSTYSQALTCDVNPEPDYEQLVLSRGITEVTLPMWLTNAGLCVFFYPPPHLAIALLMEWLVTELQDDANIKAPPVDPKQVVTAMIDYMGSNSYLQMERLLNHVHFYGPTITSTTQDANYTSPKDPMEHYHASLQRAHAQSLIDNAIGLQEDDKIQFYNQTIGKKWGKGMPSFQNDFPGAKQHRKDHCEYTKSRKRTADVLLVPPEYNTFNIWSLF
ncbi:hypothetical protein BdWA1_002138 [Babesia duncani]|uniref:Uncharacterized protein n=1 Tax=Babesia duncani TaxID=323732 RepID=A0AAD9PL80_9APIC|nr:hypothetical protein BdWA1_002138 [Babesia duncani]